MKIILYHSGSEVIVVIGDAPNSDSLGSPDVLLLDVPFPNSEIINTDQLIDLLDATTKTLEALLTNKSSEADTKNGVTKSDASNHLVVDSEWLELIKGLHLIDNRMIRIRSAAEDCLFQKTENKRALLWKVNLSPRELEVLELAAQGLNNSQIGIALSITERTVRFHFERLMKKMDAKNRTEAVAKMLNKN